MSLSQYYLKLRKGKPVDGVTKMKVMIPLQHIVEFQGHYKRDNIKWFSSDLY